MSQTPEILITIDRIKAIASRPRYAGQKADVIRECEDAKAHFHGLRHLGPAEPEPRWKSLIPTFLGGSLGIP
jgi:hypothetical protein